MTYPTPAEYQEALQHPEAVFRDPDLQCAVPRSGAFGLPAAVTGSFAVVFPVESGDRTIGVRCFLSDAASQAARYGALQEHLAGHPLEAFVGFEYQRHGISVRGRWWPVVKMEWAAGVPINTFIHRHLDRPDVLSNLAARWRETVRELQEAEIAHGDLQHGNILVSTEEAEGGEPDPLIRLVDYDAVFVPKLKGRAATEIGHRNFQHPDRTEADFDLHIDRFPAAIIYTALVACAAAPELWDAHDNGENLLFKADDFYDPAGSPLCNELRDIDELRSLTRAVYGMCDARYEDLPTLDEILEGWEGATRARTVRRRPEEVSRPPPGQPVWVTPVLALLAIAIGALAVWGLIVPAVVMGILGLAFLGFLASARYYRHPERRRRHRLEREIALLSEMIQRIEAELESLEGEAEKVRNEREERRTARLVEIRDRELRSRLKYHYVAELEAVEGMNHRTVVCLKSQAIRTAWHASPERIAGAVKLAPETKARINMWRAALVNQYAPELPESLSPGEEKRLERFEIARIAEIEKARERLKHRLAFQREEMEELSRRLREIPAPTLREFLLALTGLTRDRYRARRADS